MSGKKIKTSSIISIIVSVLILGILGSAQDIFSVEHTGVDNGGSEMEEEMMEDPMKATEEAMEEEMMEDTMEGEKIEVTIEEKIEVGETTMEKETQEGDYMEDVLGGGCLIATAAFGSELAPQVQFLREVRDNTLLSTTSGATFMTGFNHIYYSFSPAVADLERENPAFREAVKLLITPMLSTLSIMALADEGSDSQVLGLGISVIALNLGMYIAAPAAVGFAVNKHLKSRSS
jgi:hypothetical protein